MKIMYKTKRNLECNFTPPTPHPQKSNKKPSFFRPKINSVMVKSPLNQSTGNCAIRYKYLNKIKRKNE